MPDRYRQVFALLMQAGSTVEVILMERRSNAPPQAPPPKGDLPLSPSDDEIDLNDEDTDTVDELPVATDRHPHVAERD